MGKGAGWWGSDYGEGKAPAFNAMCVIELCNTMTQKQTDRQTTVD
jgi:hypothetical protein